MKPQNLPALSVITPVWNAKDYIAETITSVVTQLAHGDEYIVMDDGSSDGTADVLASLPPHFRHAHQPNSGEIAAVNAAVALASHDIIGIVNADDPILPGLLHAVRQAFADDPNLGAVYPDWLKIDENGKIINDIKTAEFDFGVLLAQHFCIPGPGAFFRFSALPDAQVRDARATGLSDYDFWLRFARNGAKIRRLPHTLATWRSHSQGTTFQIDGSKLARAKIAVIERFFALADLSPAVLALKGQALSAAYYHAALMGLRGCNVPAIGYGLRSFFHLPVWPHDVVSHQRRSMPHLSYAMMQPFSGWLHQLADPMLPKRFRHERVLTQTFGLHDDPSH